MKFLMSLSAILMSVSVMAAEIDTNASTFKWTGTKVTGKHFGTLPVKSASVKTDKKGNITGGEFVLDITKMTTEDLTGEWKEKFLKHMKSEDFFHVAKWPTAKLTIDKMDGKKAYGTLNIRDKSEKVTIPYTKKGNAYTGTFKFDRTKFGMIYGSGDFFKNLGDKMIHNEVSLDFNVVVKKEKSKKLAENN
ncbi:MAG: YceI family protein [Bdellovibrionales bacterium]|nr:YceI family protein [Bdellovibrionales bacterium]